MYSAKVLFVFWFFLSAFVFAIPLTEAQPAPCDGIQHVVQPNENLFRISLQYQVPMAVVAAANGITDPTRIYAGSTLCIPTQAAPTVTSEVVPNAPTPPLVVEAVPSADTYFRPCNIQADCTPYQTQYQELNGQEVCVAVQQTPDGWGWIPTDRVWCSWVDVARNGGEPALPAASGSEMTLGEAFIAGDGCDDPVGDLQGMINTIRADMSLEALSIDARLISAAQRHATDMNTYHFLSHRGSDGSSVLNRTIEAGYAWTYVYEDIGAGFTSADSMLNWWMGSFAHRQTILSPHVTQMGFCRKGNYWTLVLARP